MGFDFSWECFDSIDIGLNVINNDVFSIDSSSLNFSSFSSSSGLNLSSFMSSSGFNSSGIISNLFLSSSGSSLCFSNTISDPVKFTKCNNRGSISGQMSDVSGGISAGV